MTNKVNYDDVQGWIKEAGYECGKNTAMVDVFFRFANIVLERSKSWQEPTSRKKPEPKTEPTPEPSSYGSAPSPSSVLPLEPATQKQFTIK